MSKLEDLLPELAGVFAAQESAMENVVSTLTTQVAHLIQENDRHIRNVSSLEATQQQLQDALLTMRKAYDGLVDQQNAAQAGAADALNAISGAVEGNHLKLQQQLSGVEAKWHTLSSRMDSMGVGPSENEVLGLVSEQFTAVETKLTALLEERLLETSNQSFLQAQRTEEAMKTDLESLEKKFEYLSRVKTEIKDLNKKIEKQDQTLDDMRVSMDLLAKSIGANESDNESDDDDDDDDDGDDAYASNSDTTPLRPRDVDKNEVMDVMKRISQSSSDIQAKIDAAAAAYSEIPAVPPQTVPATRSRSISAISSRQTTLTRSRTGDVIPNDDLEVSPEPRRAVTSRRSSSEHTVSFEVSAPDPLDTSPDDAGAMPSTPAPIPEPTEDTASELLPQETEQVEEELSVPPEATPIVADELPVESPEELAESSSPPQTSSAAHTSRSTSEEEVQSPLEDEIPVSEETPSSSSLIAEVREVIPEEEALEEGGGEETDRVVEILPPSSRSRLSSREKPIGDATEPPRPLPGPSPSEMQYMPTAPNLDEVSPPANDWTTLIRSRRLTRSAKRQSSARRESLDSSRSETRTPMTKDAIKGLWRRMFQRFVQLQRLQILNGTSADKIFRKQNMSVGARVKRLEETTTDLEGMVDILEVRIQTNSQSVQTLSQTVARSQVDMDAKAETLQETQTMQGQMIVGVEEKLDLIELDLCRVRNANRRDSMQTAPSSAAVNALMSQHHDLASRFHDHVNTVQKLVDMDLPALTAKFETTIHDFRNEMVHKTKELGKDLYKSLDKLQDKQAASERNLLRRTNAFIDRIYRGILNMTQAHLLSVEMAKSAKSALSSSSTQTSKKMPLFDVSLEMLQKAFMCFENDCKLMRDEDSASAFGVLLEQATSFQGELKKLKAQSEKAKSSAISALTSAAESNSALTNGNNSSSFMDRLVIVTATQLKTLESLLSSETPHGDEENTTEKSELSYHIRDLVVHVRSILCLLFLHAELLDPHQKLQGVASVQGEMQHDVRRHEFALSQLGSMGAKVKMMHSRLDSFLEMSFTFAKDDDVKKSIQEMLNSSDSVREDLAQQLESTHAEAQKRDELLERELTQLVSRVNKKLDKDELLWTQEVLERQLQSMAKSSLGEEDLADIHRLLRNKLDKSYFSALLLEQRNRMTENGGSSGGAGGMYGGLPGNSPLIGAKCISCNSELPPTKAMIKSVVKDEVHQEVAKTLARPHPQQSGVAHAAPSFSASTHRSMEKHKKELLLAALQQKNQSKK